MIGCFVWLPYLLLKEELHATQGLGEPQAWAERVRRMEHALNLSLASEGTDPSHLFRDLGG